MKPLERAGYLAHARTAGFRRRVERATATIRAMLSLCRAPFVAYSGGKDSTAMLWLVLLEQPTIPVRILTGGETRLLHPSLDRVLNWWSERFNSLDLVEINVDHVFASGWSDVDFFTQHRTFFDEWNRYLHRAGEWDGVFIGTRSEESARRNRANRLRLPGCPYAIWQYRTGAQAGGYRACPLDAWTLADVGALIVTHDLPLLDTYVVNGLAARTKLRLGRSGLTFGQLEEVRWRDPARYNALLARFPELARFGSGG